MLLLISFLFTSHEDCEAKGIQSDGGDFLDDMGTTEAILDKVIAPPNRRAGKKTKEEEE